MKRRVLQWVWLLGIKKLSGDEVTGRETGKIERGSVSMVHRKGVTVATRTGSPASHAASSYFLPSPLFFYPSVLILLSLWLSLSSFVSLSCHLSGNLSLLHFSPHFAFSFLLTHTCSFFSLAIFSIILMSTLFEIYCAGVLTPRCLDPSCCLSVRACV